MLDDTNGVDEHSVGGVDEHSVGGVAVHTKTAMLRKASCARTLGKLCRIRQQPPDFALIKPVLSVLKKLMYSVDEDVLVEACWIVSCLCWDIPTSSGEINPAISLIINPTKINPTTAKVQAVIDSGICRRLVELLVHHSQRVKTFAVTAFRDIVQSDDPTHTHALMDCKPLTHLAELLYNKSKVIRASVCQALGNIIANDNTDANVDLVIRANIIPRLVWILKNDDLVVSGRATWTIASAIWEGTSKHVRYFVDDLDVLVPICHMLNDTKTIVVSDAICALKTILEVGQFDVDGKINSINPYAVTIKEAGEVQTLHKLQKHENPNIHNTANKLIELYFQDDEDVAMQE